MKLTILNVQSKTHHFLVWFFAYVQGATIVDQIVTITPAQNYVLQPVTQVSRSYVFAYQLYFFSCIAKQNPNSRNNYRFSKGGGNQWARARTFKFHFPMYCNGAFIFYFQYM